MTCIAYDGKTLAADSLAQTSLHEYEVEKIVCHDILIDLEGRREEPCEAYMSFAGDTSAMTPLIHFLEGKEPLFAANPEGDLLVVPIGPQPPFLLFFEEGHGFTVAPVQTPLAIGSGAHYAMSAMLRGLSAIEAVAEAVQLSPTCGGPVKGVQV